MLLPLCTASSSQDSPPPPHPKCCGVPGLLPQDSIPVELWHRLCQLLRVTLSHTLPTALGTAGAGAGLCLAHAASLTASRATSRMPRPG